MRAVHREHHSWLRHLPVLGTVVPLLLLPVAVVGRGGEAAAATIATIVIALIALAVLSLPGVRTMPKWATRGGLFLVLVLVWLVAYAVNLGATAFE